MKKNLLIVILCVMFSSLIIAQTVDVPVMNNSFSDPSPYVGKIKINTAGTGTTKNVDSIPYWHWDGAVITDAGREAASKRSADDSLFAYLHNTDPKMYQVLSEKVGTDMVTYTLSYLSYQAWTNGDAASIRTYFGVKNGGPVILLDSIDNAITPWEWKGPFKHEFILPDGSSNAGDSLVIAFALITATGLEGWSDVDSVTLSKTILAEAVPVANYSFSEPTPYVGKIKINTAGTGSTTNLDTIPGWHWDGTVVTDAGRESASKRSADDSLFAYLHNTDPKMYQVLDEKIGTASAIYKLNYLSYQAWTNSDAAAIRTYFGAKNGGPITLIDSVDNDITPWAWKGPFLHKYTLPDNSAYAGDSLVIAFALVTATGLEGWSDVDSVTLSKTMVAVGIPVINYSFSDPSPYVGKIKINTAGNGSTTNLDTIPGWHWDGTVVTDAGRETAGKRSADDSLFAYLHNTDPKMYQVLAEKIGFSSVVYTLNYLSYQAWTNGDAAAIRTYFGAKNGGPIILLDSTDNDITPWAWKGPFAHKYTLPNNSAYAGDSLVIAFALVTATGLEGWSDVDSITLSKEKATGPQWTNLPIAKVVFGSVISSQDFTGNVNMRWDADSVYMVYNITDDSIVNAGAAYQVDNIEIYIDMNNSKDIHWPRNGGWQANIDAAFDSVDYQLRLVPDVPFATNNSPRTAGASLADSILKQIYTRTSDGYKFELSIAWEGLKAGFVPAAGTQIGFDILTSDNDAVASDANRNQITWNCVNANPFNDPSLWGTLQFVADGTFKSILDKEPPTAPTNVVATVDKDTNVILTWNASNDNRVVQQYVILKGSSVGLDTILAKQTGNTFTLKGLADGSYTFSVKAIDVYGNKSGIGTSNKVTITRPVVSVSQNTIAEYKLYPNPASESIILTGIKSDNAMVYIYDAVGQLVLSGNITDAAAFNVSNLRSGVYMVKLQDNNHVYTTKLIRR